MWVPQLQWLVQETRIPTLLSVTNIQKQQDNSTPKLKRVPGTLIFSWKETAMLQSSYQNDVKQEKVPRNLTEISLLPSYVEFEGSFFHIAEFLSLQEGKVHRPQTSRISRWMASSQSDFYEQIDKLISPERTQNGLYLDDFGSFRVPNSGLNIGQIIRILWCPSYKSSYPVFKWKDKEEERKESGKTRRRERHPSAFEFGLT